MSTEHFHGPPPVGFLRRILLFVALIVGMIVVLALILGGALLLESFV